MKSLSGGSGRRSGPTELLGDLTAQRAGAIKNMIVKGFNSVMHSVKPPLAPLAVLNERADKNTIDFENSGCQHRLRLLRICGADSFPSANLGMTSV